MVGLVMTGGGARGAYQAGVLKRIGELKRVESYGNPFPVIAGSSAGAINAAAMAVGSDDFSLATSITAHLWSRLTPSDVFHTDLYSQARNSFSWIMDLSFGGLLGGGNARSLLDASPLRRFLKRHLDCERIQENVRQGHLYALAISATNYNSGKSYLFVQGKRGHPKWSRIRRVALPTKIGVDHICASAAIPLIFQPVKLQTPYGPAYFGDGCLRLQQPLSPVIRLGARRILAIAVRGENLKETRRDTASLPDPSLAQVMSVFFDIVFLDHLAADIEHLERLNKMLTNGHVNNGDADSGETMRPVKSLVIMPSVHLSEVAGQHERDMPYLIHYFVSGLGSDPASRADLLSYLLFTSNYTKDLIDLGYKDASERIDEIQDFLFAPATAADGSPTVQINPDTRSPKSNTL